MSRFVVDTNVPIVANGRADPDAKGRTPSIDCRLAAIDFLDKLRSQGRVLVDMAGEIQTEYRRHLNPRGQPGVGDRFYQILLESGPQRVERVELPKNAAGDFVDFPTDPALASFDPSDRKFAALGRKSHAAVAVCTDSDWASAKKALTKNGIRICFLCGDDPKAWFQK